jgi:hypothetical protein
MMLTHKQTGREPWWLRRLRPLTVGLLLAFAIAIALIGVLDRLTANWSCAPAEMRALDETASAEKYEIVVRRYARLESSLPPPDNYSILPLRIQLFIDSLVLEPAYGGLLLLYMLALRRLTRGPIRGWDWVLQLACLVLAGGIMLDLAENGMTIRAAEDGLRGLLAQATVEDVRWATQLKWAFLGAAMLMTGFFAIDRRIPAGARALKIGAWAAITVAPLAAVQAARLRFEPTIDALLLQALGIAFAAALVFLGRAVWQLADSIPREPVESP